LYQNFDFFTKISIFYQNFKHISVFTKLSAGECSGEWSSWNDRDNPSGTGDWELVHLRADYKELCKAPTAAEGRIVSTGAMATTEVVDFTVNGLICKNSDQHDKSCLDYEVRFCCRGMFMTPLFRTDPLLYYKFRPQISTFLMKTLNK